MHRSADPDPVDPAARWRDLLVGSAAPPVGGPMAGAVDEWFAALAAHAARFARAAVPRDRGTIVWPDLPVGDSTAHLTTAADRLRRMAFAATAPRSPAAGDGHLLDTLLAGCERLALATAGAPWGNWWDLQIGVPVRFGDVGILLAGLDDDVPGLVAERIADLTRVRAPGTDTGANLVWHTAVGVRLDLLTGGHAALARVADVVAEVTAPVAAGDGIHGDGSFVQHRRYAYSGGYGISLLETAAPLLALLGGSSAATRGGRRLARWVERGLRPYVLDGVVSDAVRGREVSRETTSGRDAGAVATAAVLELARGVPPRDAARLRSLAVGWLRRGGAAHAVTYREHSTLRPGSIAAIGDALADPSLEPRPEPRSSVVHPGMARAVHRGRGYALVLTAATDAIDSSEQIQGEHRTGWYAGYGARYLHTRDDPDQFAHGFWPTVDSSALAGLVVDDRVLTPERAGPRGVEPIRGWAHGRSLVFGWTLAADAGPSGHVSWLCHRDAIVAAASGLATDPGRRIAATLENRRLPGRGMTVTTEHGAITEARTADGSVIATRWAHLEGVGGFVLLREGRIEVRFETRVGSWADINRSPRSSALPLSERYVRLTVDLGAGTEFAYLLLPTADAAATARAAAHPPVRVDLEEEMHRADFGTAVLVDHLPSVTEPSATRVNPARGGPSRQ